MFTRINIAFLLLVLTQALHSFEEYAGRLWEVYPPATYLCTRLSSDPKTGFLILDISFLFFGFCYWMFGIRRDHIYVKEIIWLWIVLEMINIGGHVSWAISKKSYEPGLATAPALFFLVMYLTRQLFLLRSRPPQ